jgi:hypothetical protein
MDAPMNDSSTPRNVSAQDETNAPHVVVRIKPDRRKQPRQVNAEPRALSPDLAVAPS